MKYWKGNIGSTKEGQIGTMDDNGVVPDSVECSKQEYDDYAVANPPKIKAQSDIEKLIEYAKAQKWI